MQKLVVSSLLAVLLVPTTQAFAQFINPAMTARNLANLERVIARAAKPSSIGRPVVTLPPNVVAGNKVGVLRVNPPTTITPVTKSYATFLRRNFEVLGPSAAYPTMKSVASIMASKWAKKGDHVFYTDQTKLAQDLDAFYNGNADIRLDPVTGHEVKLYALPVEGILYKPVNYKTPVVLDPKDYFIVYDLTTHRGKIVTNVPEAYNMFKLNTDAKIWQAMGEGEVFDDLNELCDTILMAHLHKMRLEKLPADTNIRIAVRNAQRDVFKQLSQRQSLINDLETLPQFRYTETGYKVYVLELPVEGLTLMDQEGNHQVYSIKDHVMVFFELGAVGIFPREILNNPAEFTPIEK